jgi:hypothetical protein
MTGAAQRALCRLLVGALLTLGLVALSPTAGHADGTSLATLTVVGEPGNSVVAPGGVLYRSDIDSIAATKFDQGFRVDAGPPGSIAGFQGIEFRIQPAAGTALAPGDYPDLGSSPGDLTHAKPTLDVMAGGTLQSCTGRFAIIDLVDDLSRVWLLYEGHCSGRPPIFGEIRIGEPTDPEVLIAPTRVSFPTQTVADTTAVRVPINIVNLRADGPVTVTKVVVAGPNGGDFDVSPLDGCASVTPGTTCAVNVGFTPTAGGPRTAALSVSTLAGARSVGLDGTGQPEPSPPPPLNSDGCAAPGSFRAALDGSGGVDLSWTNYADGRTTGANGLPVGCTTMASLSKAVVRGAVDAAPTRPTQGTAVYAGRDTVGRVHVPGPFPLGHAYYFAVFDEYTSGAVTSSTANVVPATVTILLAEPVVTYGQWFDLGGDVHGLQPANYDAGAPVRVYARDPATGKEFVVATGVTDDIGRYEFRLKATRPTDLRVAFPGDKTLLPATSGTVRGYPQAAVRLTANHVKLKHGKPVTLSITVVGSPGAGHKVHVQRLTKNQWSDVATTKLDSHGHGSYTVKPAKKGVYDYRVVDPGTSTVTRGASGQVRIKAT